MNLGRVKEILPDSIKSLIFGKSDSRTAPQSMPYGIISKPVKGAISVYCETDNKSKAVTIGYIQNDESVQAGEMRIFATDDQGVEVFSFYIKNNGVCEFGGNADNMVRYSALNTGLTNQDKAINVELGKIATAINAIVPGAYVPLTISTNISASKIKNIKTN